MLSISLSFISSAPPLSRCSPPTLECRIQTLSWKPRAFIYHDFLSRSEARHIIELASVVVGDSHGKDVFGPRGMKTINFQIYRLLINL